MSEQESIVDFFYNLVPGILFLLLLQHYHQNLDPLSFYGITGDDAFIIFIYIVFGLFLGFVLLAITKLVRDCSWNKKMAKEVRENNKDRFKEICTKLYGKNYEDSEKTWLDAIYLMDNYLRADRPAFLPTLFSSRFTFWSNIFFAIVILIFLRITTNHSLDLDHLFLSLLAVVSLYWADKYFRGYYDSVVKSYYMKTIKSGGILKLSSI